MGTEYYRFKIAGDSNDYDNSFTVNADNTVTWSSTPPSGNAYLASFVSEWNIEHYTDGNGVPTGSSINSPVWSGSSGFWFISENKGIIGYGSGTVGDLDNSLDVEFGIKADSTGLYAIVSGTSIPYDSWGGSGSDLEARLYSVGSGSGARLVAHHYDSDGVSIHTVHDMFEHVTPNWLLQGGQISSETGLNISWTEGHYNDIYANEVKSFDSGSTTLTDNAVNYVYVNFSGSNVETSTTFPSFDHILLGRVSCVDGAIYRVHQEGNVSNSFNDGLKALKDLFPEFVKEGLIVEPDTTALTVKTSGGTYYENMNVKVEVSEIKSSTVPLRRWYHDASGNWTSDTSSTIDTSNYDTGTGLAAIPTNKYVKSLFIISPTEIHWIYPQEYFNNFADAIDGSLPTIPDGLAILPKSTALITQQGDTSLPTFPSDAWIDVRTTFDVQYPKTTITDHGQLAGLTDDDHPQYPNIADNETITGSWTFKEIHFDNQGTGDNPVLLSNAVVQLLQVNGHFRVTEQLRVVAGTSTNDLYITHSNTSPRTATFPDADITVCGREIDNNFSAKQTFYQIEIENQGSGDNPLIYSNGSTQTITFKHHITALGGVHFYSDGSYFGKLIHSNTANRYYTFPDANGNVLLDSYSPTLTGTWTFNSLVKIGDGSTTDPIELLRFVTERSWSFRKRGTGATTSLSLESDVDGKAFWIGYDDGSAYTVKFLVSDTTAGSSTFFGGSVYFADGTTYKVDESGNAYFNTIYEGGTALSSKYLSTSNLNAYLAIGSSNQRWTPCIFEGGNKSVTVVYGNVTNDDTGIPFSLVWAIPLPIEMGGKTLYISGIRFYVASADDSNYIETTKLRAIKTDGGASNLYTYTTDIKSTGMKTITFSAIAISSDSDYFHAYVILDISTNTSSALKIRGMQVRYYYA